MSDDIEEIIRRIQSQQSSFLIGTAASAHQVEGGNTNDWTRFEKIEGNISNGDISGKAANHYEMYDTDFKILEELGFRAHRLSIEWSRIFPEKGVVDEEEILHYQNVLQSLAEHNQISFVTLHHFTSPQWFIDIGGFKHKKNLIHWELFVKTVCEQLGDYIDVFNTINEPFIYCASAYLDGVHAPGEKGLYNYIRVGNNLMRAHFYAVDIIRELCPAKPVGIVKNLINFNSKPGWNPINQIVKWFSNWGYNTQPIKSLINQRIPFGIGKISRGDPGDFIGVNYYIKLTVGMGLPNFMQTHDIGDDELTQMGWGVNPEGMEVEIRKLAEKVDLPIFITENGIATDDDNWRQEYIKQHLRSLATLMEEGIDIRGYFYWSNLDNFEWAEGYAPRFGLISYDPDTFKREPKESARFLGDIASQLWNGHSILDL